MKKTIILLKLLSFTCVTLAQTECDNQVSTSPFAPTNLSLPSNTYDFGQKFLNRFDWNARDPETLLLLGYELGDVMQFNSQYMANLMDNQGPNYYRYIYSGEQLANEHGWELLAVNLGYYPNGAALTVPTQSKADVPYIILYNRYSGVLRLFANYGDGLLPTGFSFDAVQITLLFNNDEKLNGLMRLNEGYDQALDQKTDVTKLVSIAKHPNSPGDWFSADFQLAYDPCVCFYPSGLRIDFSFIDGQDLVLHGRQISITDNLIDGKFVKDQDFLTSFDYTGGNTADKGGLIMYRAMSDMVDDYIAKLEKYKTDLAAVQQHNAYVERNLVVAQLFKKIALQGGSSLISEVAKLPFWDKIITYANDLIGKDAIKKDDLVSEAKKALGNEVNTFFSKNFSTKEAPSSPNKPMATFSEMVLKGGIYNETAIDGPSFYTPGTYGSEGTGSPAINSIYDYPVYNDVVGTFALLETPQVIISRKHENRQLKIQADWVDSVENSARPYNFNLYAQVYQNWDRNYQIKLQNSLKYAVNSNLDLAENGLEVKASFKITGKLVKNGPNIHNLEGIFNVFMNANNSYNVQATDRNLGKFGTTRIRHTGDFFNGGYSFPQYFIDTEAENTPGYNADAVDYVTPYLPIDAFFETVYGIGIQNEYVSKPAVFVPDYTYRLDYTDTYNCEKYPIYNSYTNTWCYPDEDPTQHLLLGNDYALSWAHDGWHYEFDVELKLLVDMEFKTKRQDGEPNKLTQILTYKIDPSNWTVLGGEATIEANIKGSAKDFGQYPENLNYHDVTFDGKSVKGCILENGKYTCRAWNNITLEGEITASIGYKVEFIAGNIIEEINETEVNGEVVRMVIPSFNYSNPMPPATAEQVVSFCKQNSPNAPSYQANVPSDKVLAYQAEQEKIKQTLPVHSSRADFSLYPNPTSASTILQLRDEAQAQVGIRVVDLLGTVHQLSIQREGQKTYRLNTSGLAAGIYFVEVSTLGQTKMKQLLIN